MTIESGIDTVLLQVDGRVAAIELNRPDSLNALNVEMLKRLADVLKEISTHEEVDVVILRGKGRAFSAGGDIKMMLGSAEEADFEVLMGYISEIAVTLYNMPKITVCAISGAAAGLGLSLALASDYIIADKASKIAMNFIGIGLIPDGGGHFFLEKRLGEVNAKQLIWEGKPLNAEEAAKRGLINKTVDGNADEETEKMVQYLLSTPIKAMIETKRIFTQKNTPDLLKTLELEKEGQLKMRKTKDHLEGILAFTEKRKPNFTGK